MDSLSKVDLMAINFVAAAGFDTIGPVDSEEKFAAALVYASLEQRGFLTAERSDNGPVYQLTANGRASATAWGSA
jgi:hypothetical protein